MKNILRCEEITNPFEAINKRLGKIEELLRTLKDQPPPTPEVKAQDRFLTVLQAANLLGLKPPTIYRNARLRLIPSIKKGNRLLFSEQSLIAWLQSGRRRSESEILDEVSGYLNNR